MKDKLFYIVSLPFKWLETGHLLEKVQGAFFIAVTASPVVWMTNVVIGDRNFILILTFGLVMDALTGGWKHLKLRTFSIHKFFVKFMEKVAMSFCFMILINLFDQMERFDRMPDVQDYLVLTGMLVNLTYVVGSAVLNLYVISGGKFPPKAWMTRMEKFQETADLKELKGEQSHD